MYSILLFIISAIASGIIGYIEENCKLSHKESNRYSIYLLQFHKVLEGTFKDQCADPQNINLYRRLETSVVWTLLTSVNPLLRNLFEEIQTSFAKIPQEQPSCKNAISLFTEGNADNLCFLGINLRLLTFGITVDETSVRTLVPIRVTNEARRLLIEEKHFGTRVTHGAHFAELLQVDVLLIPHHLLVNNYVLNTLFESMLDLRTVALMTLDVEVRHTSITKSMLYASPFIDRERDFIRVKDKLFVDRTSTGLRMLRAWIELKALVPDGRERRAYFDHRLNAHDNFRKLECFTKKILKGGKSSDKLALACAYDCLNHFMKLIKVEDINLKPLKESILGIILKVT